ncbi:MAG: endonuclease/exonuclease/phosphatase family protein, partial [Blastocatellia bacterium]
MKDGVKLVERSIPTLLLLAFILSASVVAYHNDEKQQRNDPEAFTYTELVTLYEEELLPAPLERKLTRLLTVPFVENRHTSAEPPRLSRNSQLGEFLRVAFWNIERGLEYEAIEAALTDERRFAAMLDARRFPPESAARRQALEQAALLRSADVIILNEVDWGVGRTGYRRVAADLATRLKMNFAFGAQFVELSPVALSHEPPRRVNDENWLSQLTEVDPARYKGLHGVAILSRFPLENAQLAPFEHQPYDWYKREKDGATAIERGKRQMSDSVFAEKTRREIRRGGRTMLLADIVDERFPSGRMTIVATHLENRTTPGNRAKQLKELLARIKDIDHPVILAGDMNTSTEDSTPTSVRHEITKRIKSKNFWLQQGAGYATGFGFILGVTVSGVRHFRTQGDPTVRNIPLIAPNPERRFFTTLKNFRFTDGGAFDFRGDPERATSATGGTMANSNERADKGFVTTYQFNRPIKSVGRYKLDWIFVKPARLTDPMDRRQSYRFAPHFGRTLRALNKGVEDHISDHSPLLVDLPLGEPPLGQGSKFDQKYLAGRV